MEIILTINKEDVYREVAKTTEYTGAKMDDEHAYEVVSITEEGEEMLERFWSESKNMASGSLKKVLVSEAEASGEYSLTLGLSAAFNESLSSSMQRSLFSFFVTNITSKWYNLANKKEAAGYAAEAATHMEDIMRKAFFKKKPKRPTYD